MNFIHRAGLSLWAKKGRSLLLILLTAAIMLFILTGLLIHSAADTATTNARKSVGASLTLSANRQAAFKKMRQQSKPSSGSRPTLNMTPVKLSTVKKLTKLSQVTGYNATTQTSVNAKSFSAISTTSSMGASPMGGKMGSSSSQGDIQVNGVTATRLVDSFSTKSAKITKGRGITSADANTNHVVIESELAKQEKLAVGDTIKIKTTSTKKVYKLKIVGIYKAASTTSTQMGPNSTDASNQIYAATSLANTFKGSSYKNTADSVTLSISDPGQVSAAKTAAKKLINTSKYSISSDDSSYQQVKTSMKSITSISNKIIWLVTLAGIVILTLIVMLLIRERRHEIGILLALGEARWKIVAQFFTELVFTLIVGLVIASAGGQVVANKLGQQLTSQTQTTQTQTMSTQSGGQMGGGTPGQGTRPSGGMPGQGGQTQKAAQKTKLTTSIDLTTMVELGGLGLAIMFLATVLAAGGILRLQPKKVLID